MNIITIVKSIMLSTFLFFYFFVGNATIGGMYLFYIIGFISTGIFAFYSHVKVFISYDIAVGFILSIFLIFNFYSKEFLVYDNYEYFFWPLNALFLYIFLILFHYEENNKTFIYTSIFIYCIFFYLFAIPSIIDFFSVGTPRYSFVFGPNVYYRVISVLMIIILYLLDKVHSRKIIRTIIFLLIPYFIALLHTGSRGALFMLLVVFVFMLSNYIRIKKHTVVIIFFFLIFLSVFVAVNIDLDSRIFLIDYSEGSSMGIRLSAYTYMYEHFVDLVLSLGITQHEFQELLGGEHFHYPHNLFLELIYYYGFFGFISLLSILILIYLILRNYKLSTYKYLIYILILFLFSVSFSGDFSDNYAVLAIILYLIRCNYFIKIKSRI